MPFSGAKDGKHYWLTPADLLGELQAEFEFDFDPCPYPLPEGFDGLEVEWGQSNYVNPPFGVVMHNGKKKGATAWARKAIAEHKKGKRVVFVYPIDKWVLMLIEAGAQIRNLRDVKWCATEDGLPGKGTGRWIAMFVLEPERNERMSESLNSICPIPEDLVRPEETDRTAKITWRTPEEIINKMPIAGQLAHYKMAWLVMRAELGEARLEIERLKRALEAKP